MMTDKKFDKLMKDATDILNKMPEAHNFAHRTIYNQAALTTSWYLEDSKMEEYNKSGENPWGSINPVERFVLDCEKNISHLMGALKEMANDYDSLEQQYNDYRAMQPDEKAKNLYDHVNGRGVHLIDILVDSDKAHIKMENDRLPEAQFSTLEVKEAPVVTLEELDNWNNTYFKDTVKSVKIINDTDRKEEVPCGHWIDRGALNDYPRLGVNVFHALECSECGALYRTRPYCEGGWINANHCPNCGTNMNNEGNEENQTPPVHRTLDDWNKSGSKGSEKSFEIKIGDDGYIDQISSQGETAGPFRFGVDLENREE